MTTRRVLNDRVGDTPIVIALSEDGWGFVAFERPAEVAAFTIAGNILQANGRSYDFAGRDLSGSAPALKPVAASQEYWHSWRSFHPGTLTDSPSTSR